MASAAGAASGGDAAGQTAATSPPLSHQLRSSLLTLNLFEQPHIQSDDLTLRVGRMQTRAFIVLLPLGLLVFLLILIAQGRLITVTVRPDSYEHYQRLAASHTDMICPCTSVNSILQDILPSLDLAAKSTSQYFSGNWSAERELMPRQLYGNSGGIPDRGHRFLSGDTAHDWTAVGFRTYDNWCVVSRYIDEMNRTANLWADASFSDEHGNFWRDQCKKNECCSAKAPSKIDHNDYEEAGFLLYTLLGLLSDRKDGVATEPDYLTQWCRNVVDQRAMAIEQFWQTPLTTVTMLSQPLLMQQLQQLWANKALAIRGTLRSMLKMQHLHCVGNPVIRTTSKPCEPIQPDANRTYDGDIIRYPISMAQRFLQPFLDCNISLPPQGLQTSNPLPPDWQTNGVAYGASSFRHHFPSLIPYAFIESWNPDISRAQRAHFTMCAPTQCRYQDLMVTDVVTLLSIMLGVVSGWSGGLRIALGLVGTWWIGRQQSNGKANDTHADGNGRADCSKKDDEESSDSPETGRARARDESKDDRDQSPFSPSADSSSPHSPDDVFVHVRVHGTGAEPSPSSSSASTAVATGVKQRRVPHADQQSTAAAAAAHAAAISDSEIDDEEAPLVPRSS